MYQVFDKVLYVGPDIKGKGGISSVLASYKMAFPKFNYLSSNSRYGTILGIFSLLYLLLNLPILRLFKRIGILHVHGACGKSFVRKTIIIKYAKFLGYRIVYHSHGAEFKEYAKKVGEQKIKHVLGLCSAIVVLSKSWKVYFEDTFDLKNVYIINNIVDPPIELNVKKQGTEKIFLFLGLIGERKGIFDLLEVISENKSLFEGRLKLIVGGNGNIQQFKSYISHNSLASIVEYVGWISGREKMKLMATSDVIILPSYNEGLPIFILEAMAYSKPVISTTVGGIPEVVTTGENGCLINPGDKEEMLKAINYYLNNPLHIEREGINGYRKVRDYYPDAVRSQLYELYLGLMKC